MFEAKEDEMGGAYGTYGTYRREEKNVDCFGRETYKRKRG
jgi:hypothetical protein